MKQAKIFAKQKRQFKAHIMRDRRSDAVLVQQYIIAMGHSALRELVPYTNKSNRYMRKHNELLLDLYNHWEHQEITLREFNK